MEITILGCSGGYPSPGGATSGYLIRSGGRTILIDCGSGVLSRLFRHTSLENLDAIIISHFHNDHFCDLSVLKYAIQMNRGNGSEIPNIPIYAPGSPESLAALIWDEPVFDYHRIDGDTTLTLFDLTITFTQTEHPVECYAIRVVKKNQCDECKKVFVYTSDSLYTKSLSDFCSGADLLFMDCGCLSKYKGPGMFHMTPTDGYRLFEESGARRVVLSHLVPYYHLSEFVEEAQEAGSWPFDIAIPDRTYLL